MIGGITDKLIRRHPHVFGDVQVANSEEVLANWEPDQAGERPERESVLDGVPVHLPALMKALEVSKRVVKVGFEWPTLGRRAGQAGRGGGRAAGSASPRRPRELESELGDMLFTVVNVARFLKIDPEEALRVMVARFSGRFREVERLARDSGRPLSEMTLPEMDVLWEQAKATFRQSEPLASGA